MPQQQGFGGFPQQQQQGFGGFPQQQQSYQSSTAFVNNANGNFKF